MKKLFITIVLLLCIVFSGCLSINSIIHYEKYDNEDQYLIGSQEYIGELNEIDIDWVCGSIKLVEDENADKIIVKENDELSDDTKIRSLYENGKLTIKFAKSSFRGNINPEDKYLEITYKSINELDVDLTSGTLTASKITANDIDLDMTSGKIVIDKLVASNVDIDMTSGSIKVSDLSVDELSYDSSSGSCDLVINKCTKADFDLTSGKVTLTIPDDKATMLTFNKTTGRLKTDKTFTKVDNQYTFGPLADNVSSNIKVVMTSGTLIIK